MPTVQRNPDLYILNKKTVVEFHTAVFLYDDLIKSHLQFYTLKQAHSN